MSNKSKIGTSNKVYSYEEALKDSIKYFEGNELSAKVFLDKYALRNSNDELLENTPDKMHRRIAKEFARVEKKKFKGTDIEPYTKEFIYEQLKDFKKIIPQGSPLYGIGNKNQYVSLSNCYVLETPLDSYASILKTDEQLVQIAKRRGGVGLDISNLRPAGSSTANAARTSTGIIPFMERYSNSTREVGQSSRRGALMLTLDIHHPEAVTLDSSEDFCSVKQDLTKVTGANISLKLTDEFMNAVKKGTKYEVRFPVDYKEQGIEPLVSYKQDARKVWEKIIHSAWDFAEPGLIMWDNVLKESIPDCYKEEGFETKSCNPCSEIFLNEFDSCRLLLTNLFNFVDKPYTEEASFDWEAWFETAYVAQRLMDALVDLELECIDRLIEKVEKDPEPDVIKNRELELWKNIKDRCVKGRRTGTGITALGDTIAAMGIKYGSDESIKFVDNIYLTLKLGAYTSSVDMAKSIGAFPIFNKDKEKENPYLLRLKEDDESTSTLYKDMQKYGRRNIALLTTAPAGSVSLLACMEVNGIKYFNTSSGIEPQYTHQPYIRKRKVNPSDTNARVDEVDAKGDAWQKYSVYPSGIKAWMELTGNDDVKLSPYYGAAAEEIDWQKRVELQGVAQQHVDHSLSSTINLPNDVDKKEVAKIYETAWKAGCKGITVYRDGCRTGVLVKEDNNPVKSDGVIIEKTTAPKRPKSLNCDVFHLTYKGNRYYVVVGMLNDDPYEVFVGENTDGEGDIIVPKSIEDGVLVKKRRGRYVLVREDKDWSCCLTNGHTDDIVDALTRMVSTSLRHGVDINFIVHQLDKTEGDLQSFSKVLARTLKKYIKDGSKVTGAECPSCGSTALERREGCVTCMNCGFSKC